MSSSSTSNPASQFGPNEWLVEEMYQRFLDDPTTVDPAWHEFFADYKPGDGAIEEEPAETAPKRAPTAQDPGPAPTPARRCSTARRCVLAAAGWPFVPD